MANEMNNKQHFKVKCIDDNICSLTLGKEYVVVEVVGYSYTIENDIGELQSYIQERFEIVDLPSKDKQEFYVGDKVVVNKISDDFVSDNDDVKVGDVATNSQRNVHKNALIVLNQFDSLLELDSSVLTTKAPRARKA